MSVNGEWQRRRSVDMDRHFESIPGQQNDPAAADAVSHPADTQFVARRFPMNTQHLPEPSPAQPHATGAVDTIVGEQKN